VSFSFSYQELIVMGLVGALLAFLFSKFKIPGVLFGALSPMASSLIMAIVKGYSSGAALGGPRLPGILYILGAIWWFFSRRTEAQQAILLAGLRAGVAASVISASAVAGTEVIAGEDLTCLVWGKGGECPYTLPIYQRTQPPDQSAGALKGGPNTAGVDGGEFALVATALLLGSGILSAAILRRRD
jgi:hypothetical protein